MSGISDGYAKMTEQSFEKDLEDLKERPKKVLLKFRKSLKKVLESLIDRCLMFPVELFLSGFFRRRKF